MLLLFQTQGLQDNRSISSCGDCRGVWVLVGFCQILFLGMAKAFLEPGVQAEAEAETRDYQKDSKDNIYRVNH